MAGLSNSIFDIPSTLEQVRKTEEVIKVYTRKIIPKSGSKKENFPGAEITFDFSLSANQWWLPSRSFVVIRDVIYVGVATNPTQPRNQDDVATSFNSQDNLFDGVELTIGGFSLGSRTKLCPQISACNRRLSKSAGFNEGVAKSAFSFEPEYSRRKQDILSDGSFNDENSGFVAGTGTITTADGADTIVGIGTAFLTDFQVGDTMQTAGNRAMYIRTIADDTNMTHTRQTNNTTEAGVAFTFLRNNRNSNRTHRNEKLYVPPLGIFSQGKCLPPSRYELILRPKPDILYKQSALESVAADLTIAGGRRDTNGDLPNGTYEYLVEDIVFYVCIVENFDRVPDKQTYLYDLEETEVLPRSIGGGGNVIENFTVSKSTFALSVALQDRRAGTNTLYSPSLFKTESDNQSKLTSLRIDYAGQTRSNPAKALAYNLATGTDRQTWGYSQSEQESLGWYDTGGVLSKEDWRRLGELYHYQWRKTGDDISTDVNVDVTYDAFGVAADKHNLLLFHHFRRVLQFTVVNNQVTDFLAQDA